MSYMDKDNILSEGFFDFLKRMPNNVRKLKLTSTEKKLYKKNPKFKKLVDDMIDDANEIEKLIKQSTQNAFNTKRTKRDCWRANKS